MLPEVEILPPPHAHHWVIKRAEGPESLGVCKICHEGRDFKNYVEGGGWGDARPAAPEDAEGASNKSSQYAADGDEDDEEH